MSAYSIETKNLTKTFPGGVVAVNGLNLQVVSGSVYGLIGRNGAGKTTTLRLLMGLLRGCQGTAEVLGLSMASAPRAVRSRVAYVSQTQQLHAWMTLGELCRYVACFYDHWDADLARDLARRWDLDWNRQVGQLSGGEQRRVSILLAFASRAEVLLLDEPAGGLDPISRRELINGIIDVITREGGCTVLLSTHIIGDLERVAEYIGIMDRGRIHSTVRLDDLLTTTRRVQVIFDGNQVPEGFNIPGASRMRVSGPVVNTTMRVENPTQLESLRSIPGARVQVFPLGLEEIFIDLYDEAERN